MNKFRKACMGAAVVSFAISGLLAVSVACAADDPFGIHPGYRNVTMTINYSPGGMIGEFTDAAEDYIKRGIRLRINGPCKSACTIAVEYMHNNGGMVCLTKRAVLAFHKAKTTLMFNGFNFHFVPGGYRKEVRDWVTNNGGWPVHGKPLTEMTYKVAMDNNFYDWCN